MTSAINSGSIDVNYPTPGVNNSSQGFRNNFSSIKTNFDTAASEISDLQTKAIVKSALDGVPLSNDMNNTVLSNAQIQGFRNTTWNLGNSLVGAITVDVTNGDVQYGILSGSISLSFSKWAPVGTRQTITLILAVPSGVATSTITFPANFDNSKLTLENYNSNTVTVPVGVTELVYDISTIDCGTTLSIMPVNRPRRMAQVVTTVPSTAVGAIGDRAGTISADSNYLYVCTANYDGATNIWKRVALSAW